MMRAMLRTTIRAMLRTPVRAGMGGGLALAFALVLAPGPASRARAEELEPPPEAATGDYTIERADSLDGDSFEATFGATGRAGGALRRGDRLRFRGDGSSATLRTGADPLAGARFDAPLGPGRLRAGRLAPRWGRGLLLGAAAEPWSDAALDRGEGAPFRGRAGEGAWFAAAGRVPLELVAGRFAKRLLAGVRAGQGAFSFAVLTSRTAAQFGVSGAGEESSGEFAFDHHGRWRAEGAVLGAAGATALELRARCGHAAFRSLAEPRRGGPARAMALGAARPGGSRTWRGHAAWWNFAAGVSGARAALEVEQRLGHHAALGLGFEERQGTRREPPVSAANATGPRQGFACEWRRASGGRTLAVRHEWWGARAFARAGRGRVLSARAEVPLPAGIALTVTHSAWNVAHGESRWLAEQERDRLTLRALSGVGGRSRLEGSVPCLGGRAHLGAAWTDGAGTRAAPSWTAEWTRRTRL